MTDGLHAVLGVVLALVLLTIITVLVKSDIATAQRTRDLMRERRGHSRDTFLHHFDGLAVPRSISARAYDSILAATGWSARIPLLPTDNLFELFSHDEEGVEDWIAALASDFARCLPHQLPDLESIEQCLVWLAHLPPK
jgi:hypothetical protein